MKIATVKPIQKYGSSVNKNTDQSTSLDVSGKQNKFNFPLIVFQK